MAFCNLHSVPLASGASLSLRLLYPPSPQQPLSQSDTRAPTAGDEPAAGQKKSSRGAAYLCVDPEAADERRVVRAGCRGRGTDGPTTELQAYRLAGLRRLWQGGGGGGASDPVVLE